MAGKKLLQSFLRRRQDIVVRKSENTSIARTIGMSKETVNSYFTDLDRILTVNNLFDKPGNIFNTDKTSLQLNTRAGQALAAKRSKSVPEMEKL